MNNQVHQTEADEQSVVSSAFSFETVAAGAITVFSGCIESGSRASAGVYDLVLRDAYPAVRDAGANYRDAAAFVAKVTAIDPVAKTMTVQICDGTLAAADGAAGVVVSGHVDFYNSRQRYRTTP